jgi:hypothetical protein
MKSPVSTATDRRAHHLLEIRGIWLWEVHIQWIVDQTGKPFPAKPKPLGNPKGTGKREIRIVAKSVAAENNIEIPLRQRTESATDKVPAVLTFDQGKYF